MSAKLSRRDTITLSLLLLAGAAVAVASTLFLNRIPYVQFPFHLNNFFWSLFFVLLGILPSVAYLSNTFISRTLSIGIFAAGSVGVIASSLTPVSVFTSGHNVVFFVATLCGSFGLLVANTTPSRTKKYLLLAAIGLLIPTALFDVVYLLLAMVTTQNALWLLPILGVIALTVWTVLAWRKEYQNLGYRGLIA